MQHICSLLIVWHVHTDAIMCLLQPSKLVFEPSKQVQHLCRLLMGWHVHTDALMCLLKSSKLVF